MTIIFYNGESIQVSDEKANRVNQAIDAGAEWISINDNRYKVSNIATISNQSHRSYKTFDELNLPDIAVPKELEDVYSKRTATIHYNGDKRIERAT